MQVTILLPADILAAPTERGTTCRDAHLRQSAVEGYRSGALTETQVRRLLELDTRFQVHALLKEHQVPLRYDTGDLEDDLAAHRDLGILPSR